VSTKRGKSKHVKMSISKSASKLRRNRADMLKLLPKLDERVSVWDQHKLVKRSCPFCGSIGDPIYLRPDELETRQCEECGAFFISPAPDESVLSQFYLKYFLHHMDPICTRDKEILLSDPLDDFRVMQIASLLNPRGKTLLDIGFGKGDALVRFNKLGANVEGIEIDEDSIRFAKEELGIRNVGNFKLDQLETSKRYDIILMHDFLEHPLDPLFILTEARNRLKKGGLLSIWTPNASFVHYEKEPYLFRVDLEHLQFLTFKTCNYLARKLDLQLTHLESVGFPLVERIKRLSALNRNAARRKAAQKNKKRDFVTSSVNTIMRGTTVRNLPGYDFIKYYNRMRLARYEKNPRLGNYFLFCILQENHEKEIR